MSNPYGSPETPGSGQPGQPGYPQYPGSGDPSGGGYSGGNYGGGYGGGGYGGGGSGYGGDAGAQPAGGTDAVSITGFILSLTCCLSFIGVILGFVGLSRTKDKKRTGRWAAVSAIAVGIPLTLVAVGGTVALVWFANSTITLDSAEVGQCADVDDVDGDILLYKRDCSEEHDAEIVAVFEADSATANEAVVPACLAEVSEDITTALGSGDFTIEGIVDDPDDVNSGDTIVCYAVRTDGDEITGKIG